MIDQLKFNREGLLPAVIQDCITGQVLMVAYMNRQALEKTLETKTTWFYSRSRKKLWNKGETSGNIQRVKDIAVDCDGDTLLVLVEQEGDACHTGNNSCFYTSLEDKKFEYVPVQENILGKIYKVVGERMKRPREGSYTSYLLEKGVDKILKKIGEEATEVVIGAKNGGREEIVSEISDLLYHITVLLAVKGIEYQEVFRELQKRRNRAVWNKAKGV